MTLSAVDISELAELAVSAARQAGELISRSRPQEIQHKHAAGEADSASAASQVVTEIDRQSEELILHILRPSIERFGLGLLTEEQPDDDSRHSANFFWCIDPLDGTLPFIEGSPGYAVSIALVARDGSPVIGVICDPVENTVLHAVAGGGVFRDGRRWPSEPQSTGDVLSVFADRSLLAGNGHDGLVEGLAQIARDMGLTGMQIHATGGAVMNASRVLANPPACYFKLPRPSGGGSVWDFAATACLFGEHGAIATDMRGFPLNLNRSDSTFMNHRGVLFATDQELATRIRALDPIIS